MPMPFDATVKQLTENFPKDWLGLLGVLPLALLTDDAAGRLDQVAGRSIGRILQEASHDQAAMLTSAEFILSGLRYPGEILQPLFEKVSVMEESSTYQLILQKGIQQGIEQGEARGEAKGLRESLLEIGSERFGTPDAETREQLEELEDIARLKSLLHRVLHVSSWDDLME
jgi:flagellar biosynthesis/type III secretory pathway protein FliH